MTVLAVIGGQTVSEFITEQEEFMMINKDLNSVGMDRLEQIQDKYKFKNNYQLEAHDVYDFCNDIRQAYYLGLCMDEEDLEFIEMVLDKICQQKRLLA